jgi:3'-5' exoribonuclease
MEQFYVIGKVINVNQGANFYNINIEVEDKTLLNIKLNPDLTYEIIVGQIYRFLVKPEYKVNKENIIINNLVSYISIEKLADEVDLVSLYQIFYDFSPIDPVRARNLIEKTIENIDNQVIKDITKQIYLRYKADFYLHPAATKFHHAYIGGLAHHTYTMLKMVDQFVDIYPFLNKDLLNGGIILHDISKIKEMTGVDGEYTKEGLLIGHIVMQTIEIFDVAKELGYQDFEEVLLLEHMIVSHHGQLNFGSPKRPQIAEALALWFFDTIDSKFSVLENEIKLTKENDFTTNIAVIDKTRFYKHKLTK